MTGVRLAVLSATLVCGPAAAAGAETVRIKNLRTLCVIYRGDPTDAQHMSDAAVEQARNGVELGRLFYFRNSRARLNCEVEWLVIDGPPPATEGPTMAHIEADLRERGVAPGQFDGVFVTGIGLAGNWGGFEILSGTAGCFGGHDVRGGLTWYPADDAGVAYGTAWNFVHEFQHAIDLVIAQKSGRPDLLGGHPYSDRQEPFFRGFYAGGEHWDWIACTFREFDGWMELKGVTGGFLECADADGDGLADDDPRLPMDERRFGSHADKRDTDGDGLGDLDEFTADRYAGSDPARADTDGDGTNDAEDVYPVVPIASAIAWGEAGSQGWSSLIEGAFARNDGGGALGVSAQWNEQGLRFRFVAHDRFGVRVKLDGSPDRGFWEGGDSYLIRADPQGAVFDGLGLEGPVPGANVSVYADKKSDLWYLELSVPAELGQGVSKEINYGGQRDPSDVVDGLTLAAGRSIGVNFLIEFENGRRAAVTPHHTMYSVRLDKPADAPPAVVLTAPARTRDATPTVQVHGMSADAKVSVTAGDRLVGARIGPGAVRLSGLSADGPVTIEAHAEGAHSAPRTMVIDRTALPPESRLEGAKLVLTGEPQAGMEIWWGMEGVPVEPLGGGRADRGGRLEIEPERLLGGGWRATGYEGSAFERAVCVDVWPTIDRVFEGGSPDARLPADEFSYRFEAYLRVREAGRYTFELTSDDGARLFIDGSCAINHWGHHGMSSRGAVVPLEPGLHELRVDYCELDGWAGVKLRWAEPGGELTAELPVSPLPPLDGARPASGIELFAKQTDALGNESCFNCPVRFAPREAGRRW